MSQYTIQLRRIPWYADGALRPLGRHVEHDSRSLSYLFTPRREVTIQSVRHGEHSPVLDQGRTGACTGFTAESAAGCGPLYSVIPDAIAAKPTADDDTDERQALTLYSAATRLDRFPETYPPDDIGSTGLAAAKAMQKAGLISGYQHATDLNTAIAALMVGPIMIGIDWYSSFDHPWASGTISIEPGAVIRGGHELCVVGYEAGGSSGTVSSKDALLIKNSWGTGWGAAGYCRMAIDTFDTLLAQQADVIVPVPLSAEPPQPEPQPEPPNVNPTPSPEEVDKAMWAAVQAWAKAKGLA